MIIRMFDTAVDPDDVDQGIEIFRSTVRPAFAQFEGCRGIDLMIGKDEHSGRLTDFAAISRWDSMDAVEKAVSSDEYTEALKDLKQLFQQSPIVRHFDVLD